MADGHFLCDISPVPEEKSGPGKRGYGEAVKNQALAMYRETGNKPLVMRTLGIPDSTLRGWLKKEGLLRPRTPEVKSEQPEKQVRKPRFDAPPMTAIPAYALSDLPQLNKSWDSSQAPRSRTKSRRKSSLVEPEVMVHSEPTSPVHSFATSSDSCSEMMAEIAKPSVNVVYGVLMGIFSERLRSRESEHLLPIHILSDMRVETEMFFRDFAYLQDPEYKQPGKRKRRC